MYVKPLPGIVLAEVIEGTGVRDSGFVEPETSKERPAKGRVIEVGDDKAPVAVGQEIVYKKWQAHLLKDSGKELAFIEYKDILGKWQNT